MSEIIPAFPEVWDSTIRAAFANCQRTGYWEFIRNYRKPGGNIHLLFGGCFAKAMEVSRKAFYEKGLSSAQSQMEGIIAATAMWEDGDGDELVQMLKELRLGIKVTDRTVEEIEVDKNGFLSL